MWQFSLLIHLSSLAFKMRSYMITILSTSFGLAVAITTTSTTASPLPSLAAQIPECVAGCFPTVGTEIGCHTADLMCMCSQATVFQVHLQECMSKHKCSKNDQSSKSAKQYWSKAIHVLTSPFLSGIEACAGNLCCYERKA